MRIPSMSNTAPSGVPQGTLGGVGATRATSTATPPRANTGNRPSLNFGEEVYLWILVLLEVAIMSYLRNHFRRYHGG